VQAGEFFQQAARNKLPLTLAGSERGDCSPLDCRNQWQVEGKHLIQHIPAVRAFDIYG
jgi:hypothetical protein